MSSHVGGMSMLSLARWSIRHWRLTVGLWLVALVASLGLASGLKNHFVNNLTLPNTESQRTTDLLRSSFPSVAGDSDQIVFRARGGRLTDKAARSTITGALATVRRLPHVAGVISPLANEHAISRD